MKRLRIVGTGWPVCIVGMLVLLMAVTPAQAQQGAFVVTRDGRTIQGSSITRRANDDVILQTAQGPVTFSKNQYVRAVAPEPAEYGRAVQAIRANQHDEAVRLLQSVITSLRGLEWDDTARKLLAELYSRKGDFDSARSTYEDIFRSNPKAKEDSAVGWGYRNALLETKRYPALEQELDAVIKSGSRADAARAQIMRGDIRLSKGELRPAVLDYMRTMVFFRDVPEHQPEAMFKAAQGLENMRDDRARGIYQDLVRSYPNSPYAQQARGK